MHEERCKADEAQGRECFERTMGTWLEEGEARERAVEEGLKYAARDAGAYEKRCALEPVEEAERSAKTEKWAATAERVSVREAERWKAYIYWQCQLIIPGAPCHGN